jgi:hypothetical protein
MLKKLLVLILIMALALSMLTACSGGSSNKPDADADSGADAKKDTEDGEEFDAGDFTHVYAWKFDGQVEQGVDIGAEMDVPGIYADFWFGINMIGGEDLTKTDDDSVVGSYALTVQSSMTINADEATTRMLSLMLGGPIDGSGMMGVEVVGAYLNTLPYYFDDDGFPKRPEYNEKTEEFDWPEGKKDASSGAVYVQKVAKGWKSPIKDSDGKSVQPPVGSYLMYDTFKMDYEGTSFAILLGTEQERVLYDIDLFIVVDPSNYLALGDYEGKIYLTVTTSTGYKMYLEGKGRLTLTDYIKLI